MVPWNLKFFPQKRAEDIVNVTYTNVSYCKSISWLPTIEPDFQQERFLSEDPNESFRKGKFPKIPVIAGITANEFAGLTIGNFFVISKLLTEEFIILSIKVLCTKIIWTS